MRFCWRFNFCLSLCGFIVACGQNSMDSNRGAISLEERVRIAEARSGLMQGSKLQWKCVGQLDESGQKFMIVSLETDPKDREFVSVTRFSFSENGWSRHNEGLLLQIVNSHRENGLTSVAVARPATTRTHPIGVSLFTYNHADERLVFHRKFGGEKIREIDCKRRSVEPNP